VSQRNLFQAIPICLSLCLPAVSKPTHAATAQAKNPRVEVSLVETTVQFPKGLNVKNLPDYWVSEKLDGVRALWDGSALRFKSGRLIIVPKWFTKDFPSQSLVGELWLGRGQFESLSGIVRRQVPDDDVWSGVSFNIFDLPNDAARFGERHISLHNQVTQLGIPWLRAIPQKQVVEEAELRQYFQDIVNQGGEGLMLHKAEAMWGEKSATDLIKFKPLDDAEATVIGYEMGQGRLKAQTGALIVRLSNGRILRIGSGLSDALRQSPPPIGTQITYRYRGVTRTGLPRFATYWRVRDEE
jgi:DNA ligase 1